MPNCHVGAAVTIGSVFPIAGSVVPAAVGSDIGCGMAAAATGLAYDPARMDRSFWAGWAERVRGAAPVGFGGHPQNQPWAGFDEPLRTRPSSGGPRRGSPPRRGAPGLQGRGAGTGAAGGFGRGRPDPAPADNYQGRQQGQGRLIARVLTRWTKFF